MVALAWRDQRVRRRDRPLRRRELANDRHLAAEQTLDDDLDRVLLRSGQPRAHDRTDLRAGRADRRRFSDRCAGRSPRRDLDRDRSAGLSRSGRDLAGRRQGHSSGERQPVPEPRDARQREALNRDRHGHRPDGIRARSRNQDQGAHHDPHLEDRRGCVTIRHCRRGLYRVDSDRAAGRRARRRLRRHDASTRSRSRRGVAVERGGRAERRERPRVVARPPQSARGNSQARRDRRGLADAVQPISDARVGRRQYRADCCVYPDQTDRVGCRGRGRTRTISCATSSR